MRPAVLMQLLRFVISTFAAAKETCHPFPIVRRGGSGVAKGEISS